MRYVNDFFVTLYDFSPVWSRSILSSCYGLIKERKENTNQIEFYRRKLSNTHQWSKLRLEEFQHEKFTRLIKHAHTNVEYYNKLFVDYGINPSQIQTQDDLKKIPKLTKKIIRREGKNILAKNINIKKLRKQETSGTTGSPLTVFVDEKTYLYGKAIKKLQHQWAGYNSEYWIGIFGGYKVIPMKQEKPPFWTKNYLHRQIHFSTYHLNPKYISHYIEKLMKEKIQYISGYPSAIGFLAKHIEKNGIKIPLKAVFLSSEPILKENRILIKKAFDCQIFDFYGQGEIALFAANCGKSDNLHIVMESGIAELLPLKIDPRKSEIVATSLNNYAMPLIRYELKDITTEVNTECPCGSKHKLIGPIETRTGDYVLTHEGTFLSPRLLSRMFSNLRGIDASQIVQDDNFNITVNIVPNKFLLSIEQEHILKERVKSIVGHKIKVEICKTNEIPLTKTGKHRFVISAIANSRMKERND